jgi:hypothetical protein
MRQLAIQVLLIIGIVAVAWRLLGSYGQRAQALRRIGLLVLAAFAVWSILDPNILTNLANRLGIGRGADLVLYGLVLAFFGFVVTTFRRFRDMEVRYTRLARRIALDEAPPPVPPGPTSPAAEPADRAATSEELVTDAGDQDTGPATAVDHGTEVTKGGIPDISPTRGVTSATPNGGPDSLRTGSPERLAGSPSTSPSLKAADAD